MSEKSYPKTGTDKVVWSGRVVAVQPRIRLTRSFDERHHSYQGYVLRINGRCGDVDGEFMIAVGRGAHERHQFQVGMQLSGLAVAVPDPRLETAWFYKTSRIQVGQQAAAESARTPPFLGVPPNMETYRSRGHRRLNAKTYDSKCVNCLWGCRMPVEIIVDQWNPSQKRYRFETFCYGPKSCSFYRPGAARQVPGRKGMSYIEEDWVDEEATAHRGPDE